MPTPARNTIVIDNGGHRCRVGFAGEAEPRRTMMNGMAKSKTEHKTFVADQVEKAKDFSALQYRLSLERGVLVNWDTQAEVWARAFGPEVLKIAPAKTSLLLSEAPLTPSAIQDTLDEMVFEHFGFHSYCTRPAPTLARLFERAVAPVEFDDGEHHNDIREEEIEKLRYQPKPMPEKILEPLTFEQAMSGPKAIKVGDRLRLWWEEDQAYEGTVTELESLLGRDCKPTISFRVAYDDGDDQQSASCVTCTSQY